MAISIKRTKDIALTNGVKVLVHGKAGVGKTRLCATAPKPIIISAEAGLLSLAGYDIPAIEIHDYNELFEAYKYVESHIDEYETVCLDSISEIAEQVLSAEKKRSKDGRAAYGDMQDIVTKLIRSFRDLPMNVYFSCKQEKAVTDNGLLFMPSMPGKTLTNGIAYFFDEVFALGIATDDKGPYRYLQTQPDASVDAKDRSGRLDPIERPDLTYIFNKIKGEQE